MVTGGDRRGRTSDSDRKMTSDACTPALIGRHLRRDACKLTWPGWWASMGCSIGLTETRVLA
jgi:hypothetical protein